jgi:hypothetical protein
LHWGLQRSAISMAPSYTPFANILPAASSGPSDMMIYGRIHLETLDRCCLTSNPF